MNPRDRANLEFLLNIGLGLANWYAQASADDIEYATELLEAYEQELAEQEMNLLEEDFGVNLISATRVLQ
jgi:hypothetical protein